MRRYCNYCECEQEFIDLKGNQFAVLRGNSHAELWENSHAVLRENSHAVLWGNSHAELWGNSHAELWGNSHAELWENSHAQCRSPHACGILKSITAKCKGRHIGDKPISPKEYLKLCGVEVKNQYIILFKSVKSDYHSYSTDEVKYEIDKEVVAPDWNANAEVECGLGLHLSPTIQQAMSFNCGGIYLACRVKLCDIASLPAYAQYPDKIRVRACVPLYQVNEKGEKIEENDNQ